MNEPKPSAPATPADLRPPTIELWPSEVLAQQLQHEAAVARTRALAMATQRDAPVDECEDALVACAGMSAEDPVAAQLVCVAMGMLDPKKEHLKAEQCLAGFTGSQYATPVRIAAAHALFRLNRAPPQSWAGLADMLYCDQMPARKIALLALQPVCVAAAGEVSASAARRAASEWSSEGLTALARSAGNNARSQQAIESFVVRGLEGQTVNPTGIAAYVALATTNPGGLGIPSLVKIATSATEPRDSNDAVQALAQLGDAARPAARDIASMLTRTDDPEREETIIRALVQLRAEPDVIPLARVVERIGSAPDRAVAAHCLLLCLHAKSFASAASVVKQRFSDASEALGKVLAQTYTNLTGHELSDSPVAGRS